MKIIKPKLVNVIIPIVAVTAIACWVLIFRASQAERDSLIDEPFSFGIKTNMMDDYKSIGAILTQTDEYPLWKENIADCAFCMIRTIEYKDMTVRVFSFDVAATGTAEYTVHGPSIRLRSGIAVGSTRRDALHGLGKLFKEENNSLVWKSKNGNFLVVYFDNDIISRIRWHQSREATYKNVRVWETLH